MTRFEHGLVLGKFLPPHAGHHHLVRTAAAGCARVSVVVLASVHEPLTLDQRVAWLRAAHAGADHVRVVGGVDEVPVDYDHAPTWDAHLRLVEAALARAAVLDGRPGAESSGTTVVSRQVARRLAARGGVWAATRWVPEYGRDYSAGRLEAAAALARRLGRTPPALDDLVWTPDDFAAIARRQLEMEDVAAGAGSPVLVCDTDAFATGVWHERYVGTANSAVEALAQAQAHHLYLLTDHADVPFVQDGLRDGESVRAWMTGRFVERLDQTSRRWALLQGPEAQRATQALAQIDLLVDEGWAGRPCP